MITKSVKYEDLEGNPVVKDFDFHLNKSEIAELQFREDGSTFDDVIIKISQDETNVRTVLNIIKEIVTVSVGRRSEDGKRFIKDDIALNDLVQTDAYSELLFDLISSPDSVAKFVKGLLPRELARDYDKTLNTDDLNNLTEDELKQKLADLRGDK